MSNNAVVLDYRPDSLETEPEDDHVDTCPAPVRKVREADIRRSIIEAFRHNAELDAERLTIKVENGRVELRGRVRSLRDRHAAELAAWSVPGVAHVWESITLD